MTKGPWLCCLGQDDEMPYSVRKNDQLQSPHWTQHAHIKAVSCKSFVTHFYTYLIRQHIRSNNHNTMPSPNAPSDPERPSESGQGTRASTASTADQDIFQK